MFFIKYISTYVYKYIKYIIFSNLITEKICDKIVSIRAKNSNCVVENILINLQS